MNRKLLHGAIKSLRFTKETVVFVDMDQIPVNEFRKSCLRSHLPKALLICAVKGPPNVEAMTRKQLQAILDRKDKTK